MGWKLVPLGLPELISREWSVAVKMPIEEVTLQSTRAFSRHRRPRRHRYAISASDRDRGIGQMVKSKAAFNVH